VIKNVYGKKKHEESFNKLKKHLISEPLLKHFNDEKEFYLTIDASIMGLGACLEQPYENNILPPVGYAFRKLLNNEKTYSSITIGTMFWNYVGTFENTYGIETLLYFVTILVYNITKI